ncbi:MAG: oligosaccharide flippase family protein [Flavobacteriaceae bacterium]|nr:oligosaccharide flippase family protein [Flavobacteriaceae bacterium]MBT5011405.1 oligosaccharide flippase family protein [Flavobacteriaceae bacterium]MBT5857768.1 oligosaccharide flippase family protein [Flavobacteriaceae bacterium]|tara:strand:+ start:1656 stop:2891 length:1236 start_codon:yes stop_codon:yes gene_type:complete
MSNKVKNAFFKNFFNLSLNQGINILVAIIVTPILFQNLGESEYGLVNLAFSIVMILSIIVSYGYHLNGPKRISLLNTIEEKKELINEIISLRISLAFITTVLIYFLITFSNFFIGYENVIMFSLVILYSEALHPIFYLQGENNLSILAVTNAISKLIYVALIILLIKNPDDSFLVNLLFGGVLSIVYLVFWVSIFLKNNIRFAWPKADKIIYRIKENFDFFFSSIAGHISIHGGIIILSNFIDNIELGKFALAQRIGMLLRMIPIFITQAVLQNASVINQNRKSYLNDYLNKFYLKGLLFTFVIGILVTVTSKWIIIFLSGEEILYSQEILSLLSFIPFLGMLNFKNIIKILVEEKKKILNKATWITVFFMISLSIIMSFYFGGKGLAIALLFSEFISFIIHSILLNNENK